VGRIQAAQALGRLASADATAWLGAALRREAHWAVQAEIAAALGQVRTTAAEAALLGALDLPDPRARRGVAAGLAETRSARAGAALRRLADTDPSPFVAAEALRGLGRTRDPGARPVLLAALRARDAWNDVVRAGAVDGLADLGGPAALAVLRARTRYGHPHPSRVAAVAALGRAGAGDPGALRTLLARTRDPHLRVQTAAIRALGALGDERALPRLRALAAARDVDGRVPRAAAEAFRAIAGDAPGAGPRGRRPGPPAPATGRGTRG
jgi:aminopeptidase N